jgi:uncharacterized protein (TIGR02145 family)
MEKSLLKSIQILVILSLFFVVGCKKDVLVTSVTLAQDNITLNIGETAILTATIHPSDATNQAVSWASDNLSVVTVTNGTVTANEAGSAIITVTTNDGNYTATCTVVVTPTIELEWIEISGVKWAKRNVDKPGTFTANPEDTGMFYQWNRKTGWSSTDPLINSDGGTTWDDSMPNGDSWKKANDPCPTGWRIPTFEEQQSLVASGSEWTTLNGVNGRYFGGGDKRVFFPVAGYRSGSDGTLFYVGIGGDYWSSTPTPANSTRAYHIGIDSGDALMYVAARSHGLSVRCVSE